MHNERKNYENKFMTIEQENSGICVNRCVICGQWILATDPYYIVIFDQRFRSSINHGNNLGIHKAEWDELIQKYTPDQIIEICQNLKRKPYPKWGEEQQRAADAFKKVMQSHGYRDFWISKNKREIKAKKKGSSLTYILNVWDLRIDAEKKFDAGLFGGMMLRDMQAQIYNEIHKELNTGNCDSYSSTEVMKEAKRITDEIMGV